MFYFPVTHTYMYYNYKCILNFYPLTVCRSVFNSPANSAVVGRLIKEVQILNPTYQASVIKGILG